MTHPTALHDPPWLGQALSLQKELCLSLPKILTKKENDAGWAMNDDAVNTCAEILERWDALDVRDCPAATVTELLHLAVPSFDSVSHDDLALLDKLGPTEALRLLYFAAEHPTYVDILADLFLAGDDDIQSSPFCNADALYRNAMYYGAGGTAMYLRSALLLEELLPIDPEFVLATPGLAAAALHYRDRLFDFEAVVREVRDVIVLLGSCK